VEVLRRAGKPLHYQEIAEVALRDNLLSHVGQDPKSPWASGSPHGESARTIARCGGVARGDLRADRMGGPAGSQVEAVAPPTQRRRAASRSTGRENASPAPSTPRPDAGWRAAAEHEEGYEGVEAERRRQDQGRKGQRRFPRRRKWCSRPWRTPERRSRSPIWRPSCCAAAAFIGRAGPRSAFAGGRAARRQPPPHGSGPQAGLHRRRRAGDAGGVPPPSAPLEEARAAAARSASDGRGAARAEVRRAVTRALRRRIAEMDTSAFETSARRCWTRWHADRAGGQAEQGGPALPGPDSGAECPICGGRELVRGGREIGRADVQELRKDLAHYSAQMGLGAGAGGSRARRSQRGQRGGASSRALYLARRCGGDDSPAGWGYGPDRRGPGRGRGVLPPAFLRHRESAWREGPGRRRKEGRRAPGTTATSGRRKSRCRR